MKQLIKYKEFFKTCIKKDIRGKYKKSFLGILWTFINPLFEVLIYALIFPLILKNEIEHYIIFLISGVTLWNFIYSSIINGTQCIVSQGDIIKKIYFPREILPITSCISSLINYLITCIILIIITILSGGYISYHIIFFPIIILILLIYLLGFNLLLSSINVYARDVEFIIRYGMNLLFYATPIVYSADLFANSKISILLKLNPFTHIIESVRDIFFYHQVPEFLPLSIIFAIGILFLILSYIVFKKLEKRFAETL